MMVNDPIGDLITRIRNAQRVLKQTVKTPASKMRARVLDVLKKEGYIRGYTMKNVRPGIDELVVELKYFENQPVIRSIERVSKPGRRVYSGVESLPRHYNGLGISILSTSSGVLSDIDAREKNVGGEILVKVY